MEVARLDRGLRMLREKESAETPFTFAQGKPATRLTARRDSLGSDAMPILK
jgi:hypothetical protein